MKRIIPHIKLLLLGCSFMMASCQEAINLYNEECDYSVRLVYDYNAENMSHENLLPMYVRWIDQYIFDQEGVLYAISPISADVCDGTYNSELMLPPGHYSAIAVGNQTSMSEMRDSRNGIAPQIGVTRREDMLLSLTNERQTRSNNRGYYDNCGRLYYGYRTFSVENGQVSNVRVDMVHSHCVIRFTIRWRGTPPANAGEYYVSMTDVPSEYNLMPEYVYPEPGNPWAEYDCDIHDLFALQPTWVKHHIPHVHNDRNILTHRNYVQRVGSTISGETVNYRLRNDGNTTFALFTAEDHRTMKEIPINKFLTDMEIDLDHTLKQEYDIIFEIDEPNDKVYVFFTEVADWDEGSWFQ